MNRRYPGTRSAPDFFSRRRPSRLEQTVDERRQRRALGFRLTFEFQIAGFYYRGPNVSGT